MRWSLGVLFSCAGCALVADLGEERTLATVSTGAAGENPGGAGEGAGGAAAGAGGQGTTSSSGGAATGGAGGVGGEGGVPEGLLHFQDFEATSADADCSDEEPPIGSFPNVSADADCDHGNALAGAQSAYFEGVRSVFCDDCLPEGESELWAEFLLRVEQPVFPNSWFAFGYTNGAHRSFGTGSGIVWSIDDNIKLSCFEGTAELTSVTSPQLDRDQIYLVTHHHDWVTGHAEFWVREVDESGGPAEVLGDPTGTIDCAAQTDDLPTSWYSDALYDPGGGQSSLDDVRVARGANVLTP